MLFFILITDKDFASIYNKYNKYAYTVSKRTIERKYNKYDFPAEEIKDILQISFVKLYFYLQKTENVDYMKSLIARITELTTINYLNKYINDSRQIVAEYYDSDDSELTDRELTDQQFQQLYYKYIKYAGTVCINTINKYYPGHRSVEEIEDILQESFLNVYIYLSRTDSVRNIKALIAHITRLSTIKLMSKYIKPINTNILPSADEDPTEIALNNINYAELIEYIKKLHPKYSSVILLKNVYGVKLTTIAEITDIPYNTILSWHLHGKKLIAKKLGENNR